MILPLALILCFMVGCQDKEAMAELEAMKPRQRLRMRGRGWLRLRARDPEALAPENEGFGLTIGHKTGIKFNIKSAS